MFSRSLEVELFEPYGLGAAGVTLWQMVYFRGRARAA
jgi:hypothetical protein